ncbi:MAG: Abi family protein, partial [Clostridiales bacterium]|nr:Abi family protein [Clostridiales bacterium]
MACWPITCLSRIIEQIEFYLRTQISYRLSFEHGALGYLNAITFNFHHNDEIFKEKIAACIADNKLTLVVKHHNQKYGGKFPLWVIIEFFSMGTLSYLYADLLTPDKKQIAATSFNTSADCLQSWLRCLTDLRNRCAHYSRLYYWIFSAVPKTPQ